MSWSPLKRDPGGGAAFTTTSAVTASRSRLVPRRRRDRWPALPGPALPPVAFSIPEGREGGRGGRPFSRATSSRSAWFSAFSPAFAEPSSATFTSSAPTSSRSSASDKPSSDVVSGDNMGRVNHAAPPRARAAPGVLPRLPLVGSPGGAKPLQPRPQFNGISSRTRRAPGPLCAHDARRGKAKPRQRAPGDALGHGGPSQDFAPACRRRAVAPLRQRRDSATR